MPARSKLIILAASVILLATQSVPVAAADVTIEGGGWGHGIGMPQYGAKAMAESGSSGEEIVEYFYTGAEIGMVGEGAVVGHADPLRIGLAQSSLVQPFSVSGGPVQLCLEGNCDLEAAPGDGVDWSLQWVDDQCQYFDDSTPLGEPGACEGGMTWSDGTLITFPDIGTTGRTIAHGNLQFTAAPTTGFHLVAEMGLEPYLYGLGEMPSSWHHEAMVAQAIASRTYAVYKAWVYRDLETQTPVHNELRWEACACHLFGSTLDQKYVGWAKESEPTWGAKWVAAVDDSAGKVATHDYSGGRALQAYYYSSSGGATENNEDVWGGTPFPYLRSVSDPGPTTWAGDEVVTLAGSVFASLLGFDEVFAADLVSFYDSGSPSNVEVTGLEDGDLKTESFTGVELRTILGLRSQHITDILGLEGLLEEAVSGDFDGDGKDDLGSFYPATGEWRVSESTGSGFTSSVWTTFSTKSGWTSQVVGDFNGDGKDDIGNYHPVTGNWVVSKSTGSGFTSSVWTTFSTKSGWTSQVVGDFNGDGKDDIGNYHPVTGNWVVSKSTGSGFTSSVWTTFSTKSGWTSQVVGDFNGDGKDDIGNYHPVTGNWVVSKSTGSGFTSSVWTTFSTKSGWTSQVVGDFNGDGKDDIGNYHPVTGNWVVSKSTGSGFTSSVWTTFSTKSGWTSQVVGDFNGDGKDDIGNYHPVTGNWVVSKSIGSNFASSVWATLSPKTGWTVQLAGDFSGDGDHDVVSLRSALSSWVLGISNGSNFTEFAN